MRLIPRRSQPQRAEKPSADDEKDSGYGSELPFKASN